MKSISKLTVLGALASVMLLAGCASQNGYQKAFSEQTALIGNSRTYNAPADQILRTVKQALVRQGFTIEHADASTGLIKATRNMQDGSDEDVSYNIHVSADVTESPSDKATVVTLAASQQTVLHREWHTWWHLLWLIPIFPTGTEYQTVVTQEGNVTDSAFYKDFFAAFDKSLPAPKTVSGIEVSTSAPANTP